MVIFQPPELRKELSDALLIWDEFEWDLPSGISDPDEWDTPGTDAEQITPKTEFELHLPDSEQSFPMSCDRFIETMSEFAEAELVNNTECWTPKRILIRVAGVNEEAVKLLRIGIPEAETEEERAVRDALVAQYRKVMELEKAIPPVDVSFPNITHGPWKAHIDAERELAEIKKRYEKPTKRFFPMSLRGGEGEIHISLTTGFTMFGLVATAEGLGHDYYPLFSDFESFVEIRFGQKPSASYVSNIVHAFLFELSSSATADFKIEARLAFEELDEDEPYEALQESARLRPLMVGKGMGDLLELYTKAMTASDPEIQVLYCTKVAEYVAQTVIRKQGIETIRTKLLSPRALAPDAAFIIELQSITAKTERAANEDKAGIKLTVLMCCDATELATLAPDFLTEFKNKHLPSQPLKQKQALIKFALSLNATRNSIAHAKANYVKTGRECPPIALPQFAACALHAARQMVQWFHTTSEDIRVVP